MARGNKAAILVAGMHRSGTSAVTRVLNLLGCDLPADLLAANPTNPTGHWEPGKIVSLNDEILASAGSAWNDWTRFDPRWRSSPVADAFAERAQAVLAAEFGDSRLFVIKDPRIARLLPFWIEAARTWGAEPLVVMPIRNPLDVAASLETRDGIDPSVGQLLWLRHALDAERDSRGRRRAWLRYDGFLAEPHSAMDALGAALNVSWPKRLSANAWLEIEAFLSPALRHHRSDDRRLTANPAISRWIVSSFEIFDRWRDGKTREKDTGALDRIRAAFDAATPAFARALAAGAAEIEGLTGALAARDGRVAELERSVLERDGRLEEHARALAAGAAEIEGLTGALAARDGRVAELERSVAERDGRLEEHARALAGGAAEIEGLTGVVAARDGRVAELERSVAERDGRLEEHARALAAGAAEIEGLTGVVAARDGRVAELERSVAERDGRLEEHARALAAGAAEIEGLTGVVAARDGRVAELERSVAERDGRLEEHARALAAGAAEIDGLTGALAALHNSRSWRVTAPLRTLRRIQMRSAWRIRRIASRTVRTIYRVTPLPTPAKTRIKEFFFRRAPWAFKHTYAYRMWATTQDVGSPEIGVPVSNTPQEIAQDSINWGIMAPPQTMYIAEIVASRLQHHGWSVEILNETPADFSLDWYLVFFPKTYEKLPPAEKMIVFEFDTYTSAQTLSSDYITLLQSANSVIASSIEKIEFLHKSGISYPDVYWIPVDRLPPPENSVEIRDKKMNEFFLMLDRFLIAKEFLPVDYMLTSDQLSFDLQNHVVLSLPETIDRREGFLREKKPQEIRPFSMLDGLRHRTAWIGCGLSYSIIARRAVQLGMDQITIMEDDVDFPSGFDRRYAIAKKFLKLSSGKWDIFSGLISDVRQDTKVLSVEEFDGITFATIDRMTSTVFNIYSEKAIKLLASWEPSDREIASNTIDRFLERQDNIRVVVIVPYLVAHRESVKSTVWSHGNKDYVPLIQKAEKQLEKLIEQQKRKAIHMEQIHSYALNGQLTDGWYGGRQLEPNETCLARVSPPQWALDAGARLYEEGSILVHRYLSGVNSHREELVGLRYCPVDDLTGFLRECRPPPTVASLTDTGGFTLVTPFFRHLEFFKETAASVDRLFFVEGKDIEVGLEWVIVNDDPGVTDNALEEQIPARLIPLVRLVQTEGRGGIVNALNTGIRCAKHRWILLVDCDDIIEPNAIDVLTHYIARFPQCRYISSSITDIDEKGNILRYRGNEHPVHRLFDIGMLAGHLKSYRRDLFDEIGVFDSRFELCQDYEFALRTAMQEPILKIPEPIYRYRWHKKTQSVSRADRQNVIHLRIQREYMCRFLAARQQTTSSVELPAADRSAIDRNYKEFRGAVVIDVPEGRENLLSETLESIRPQSPDLVPIIAARPSRSGTKGNDQVQPSDDSDPVILRPEADMPPNRWNARAANLAIDYAKAHAERFDYIVFLDAGDIVYPFFSSRASEILNSSGADILYARGNRRGAVFSDPHLACYPQNCLVAENVFSECIFSVTIDFVRRSGVEFDEDTADLYQWDFLLSLLWKGAQFQFFPEPISEHVSLADRPGKKMDRETMERKVAKKLRDDEEGLDRFRIDMLNFGWSDVRSDGIDPGITDLSHELWLNSGARV